MMRFAIILILGCAPLLCLGAPPKDMPTKDIPEGVQLKGLKPKGIEIKDYFRCDQRVQKSVGVAKDEYTSEWGFIRHVPTGMIVYAENCSAVGSTLKIGYNEGKGPLEVRYVSSGPGHTGHFDTNCETRIGPEHLWPRNEDRVVLTSISNSGCSWIDEESTQILYKYGDPASTYHYSHYGGSENPEDGAELVLKESEEETSRFQFVPNAGPITAYYPKPEISGQWFRVGEVMVSEPGTSEPYELEYTVGRTVFNQAWSVRSWRPAPCRAFDWFRESELNYYACRSESNTWGDLYQKRKEVFQISYGLNVFYQWSFIAEQNKDAIRFRSSIITIANVRDEIPEIIHVGEDKLC